MNILFFTHFFVGFMVPDIPKCPYSGTVLSIVYVFGYFPLYIYIINNFKVNN